MKQTEKNNNNDKKKHENANKSIIKPQENKTDKKGIKQRLNKYTSNSKKAGTLCKR